MADKKGVVELSRAIVEEFETHCGLHMDGTADEVLAGVKKLGGRIAEMTALETRLNTLTAERDALKGNVAEMAAKIGALEGGKGAAEKQAGELAAKVTRLEADLKTNADRVASIEAGARRAKAEQDVELMCADFRIAPAERDFALELRRGADEGDRGRKLWEQYAAAHKEPHFNGPGGAAGAAGKPAPEGGADGPGAWEAFVDKQPGETMAEKTEAARRTPEGRRLEDAFLSPQPRPRRIDGGARS